MYIGIQPKKKWIATKNGIIIGSDKILEKLTDKLRGQADVRFTLVQD